MTVATYRNVGWKLRAGASVAAIALLAACGGGGTPRTTPPPLSGPAPSPTPPPAPTPTPTPPSVFETQEYARSDGPEQHEAIYAWQRGATGDGVAIAILDTGIDVDSPEFAGRILPTSRDVAGSRSIQQEDDHGTNVALVAAAARNNIGVVGIAYEADLLVLRGDAPGTCADLSDDGSTNCRLRDTDIATGINYAVDQGARIINLSLGGGNASLALRDAVSRAVAAGVVVVVSSGNDGSGSPDTFAQDLANAGTGGVVIVGSVDAGDNISSFSNRAGSFASQFISARGEQICCVYEDGAIKTETDQTGTYAFLFSGTSFAAPQVAGAIALLLQAFPNLTAQEVVELLLESASDAGATGDDDIYGKGILDIAAAFAPAGTTSIASTGSVMALSDSSVVGSPAMGDALASASMPVTVLDKYRRAYVTDIGARTVGAQVAPRLTGALTDASRSVAIGAGEAALSFTIDDRVPEMPWSGQLRLTGEDAERARVLAARVVSKVAADMKMGFAFRQGSQGLVAQVQGQSRPAFLVAPAPDDDTGFALGDTLSIAMRRQAGQSGLTFSAESGNVRAGAHGRFAYDFARTREEGRAMRFGAALDRRYGPLAATLGASWLREENTLLGARFHDALGVGGADSLFLDTDLRFDAGAGWRLGGSYRRGWTFAQGVALASDGWAFDIERRGVLAEDDGIALRLSQPLRVASGGIDLTLPVHWDYGTRSATFATRRLSLAPTGREVIGEIAWRGRLWGGMASASLFYRTDPGHYATLPDDPGAAVRWSTEF
ncbi:S8 family peptidase [Pseudoblastomonas halimionae]|uniref:S8 family serine peptidase n=1 Tax=Alteriqipengyuania halimionae TaxID=1926630 RepID=A0A6I4U0Y9_9SPHN|nr:S8 family peptidase [Alteriqipengyuania halimionae]MXP08595.1 S8 family serine peptidase [Alteriqipengyuania halimionae]